jgi:hypothetical protein
LHLAKKYVFIVQGFGVVFFIILMRALSLTKGTGRRELSMALLPTWLTDLTQVTHIELL